MTAFVYDDIELIFIHVPKTGGTSVTDCLVGLDFVNQAAIQAFNLTDHRKIEYIADGHVTATELRKRIGDEKYKKFFSFTIMREPYDWLLSLFAHGRSALQSLQDFENFIDEFDNIGQKLQSDWFTTDGAIDVDYVVNFSHLENGLDKVVTHIEQSSSIYTSLNNVVPINVFISDLRKRFPPRKTNVTQHRMNIDAYRNNGVLNKATKLIQKDLQLYEDLFGIRKEFI